MPWLELSDAVPDAVPLELFELLVLLLSAVPVVTALSIAGIRVPEMKKAPSIYTVCYITFIFNYSN